MNKWSDKALQLFSIHLTFFYPFYLLRKNRLANKRNYENEILNKEKHLRVTYFSEIKNNETNL